MFVVIRGHRKNEKDANKSKGLSTWITIVIYLLRPGFFLSIKSHHILQLRRKAGVIASHTNQHNLCNYALKVTLEAESDVSSLDSGDISDSSGDFQPRCEETSHSQTKLFTQAVYSHKHKEKTVNQAEVITKQNWECKGSLIRPLSQVYWSKATILYLNCVMCLFWSKDAMKAQIAREDL